MLAVLAGTGACGRFGATIDEPARGAAPGEATVDRVVDGDTVRVRLAGRPDTESVRLIGIDTPETHGPGGLRECFGQEASARLAELLPGDTEVRLVRDAEARDRYGRLLAYVWLPDGRMLNRQIAADGYAQTLTIPPNVEFADVFRRAAAAARRAALGLWRACGAAG